MSLGVLIAIITATIALFGLAWKIYKDLVLKPKIKVKFRVMTLVSPMSQESPTKLDVIVVNFGPGKIRLNGPLKLRKKAFLRKTKHGILIQDYRNPLSAQFPCELEVGDEKDFLLQFDKNCFLKEQYTHIGVKDSFGRVHWAPKKHFKEVKKTYKKWFEENEGNN